MNITKPAGPSLPIATRQLPSSRPVPLSHQTAKNIRAAARTYLHEAAHLGHSHWQGMLDPARSTRQDRQPELQEICNWARVISEHCGLDDITPNLPHFIKILIDDKEPTAGEPDRGRRWAAFYATFNFLRDTTSYENFARNFPRPNDLDRLLSLASEISDVFFAATECGAFGCVQTTKLYPLAMKISNAFDTLHQAQQKQKG